MKQIAFLILILAMCALACTNAAYKRVAADYDRTQKHKQVLLQICEQLAPPSGVVYIKGKDSVITTTDTVTYFTTDTVTKTITAFRDIIQHHYQSRVDTVKVPDNYRAAEVESKLKECRDASEKTALKLVESSKENESLRASIRNQAFTKWMGWIVVAGIVLVRILKLLKFITI